MWLMTATLVWGNVAMVTCMAFPDNASHLLWQVTPGSLLQLPQAPAQRRAPNDSDVSRRLGTQARQTCSGTALDGPLPGNSCVLGALRPGGLDERNIRIEDPCVSLFRHK